MVGAANPATLRCNDMVVGVSTHDVLKHLSAAELAVGTPAGADRMARLAAHLPAQASYYPLYPPPLGAALDTSQVRRGGGGGLHTTCTGGIGWGDTSGETGEASAGGWQALCGVQATSRGQEQACTMVGLAEARWPETTPPAAPR